MSKKSLTMSSKKILKSLMLSSIFCILISIFAGVISSLHYVESISIFLEKINIHFASLRPIHTIFASSWLFLGGITVIFYFLLNEYGSFSQFEKKIFKIQMIFFSFSGLGILITIFLGNLSGREYLGFNPVFSIFIIFGWMIFSYIFFKKILNNFWASPVYIYMWSSGILYFLITFIESHFYLLSFTENNQIIDMQIQWKSYGSLVASFNQIIHGGLLYIAELLNKNKKIAHSKSAFYLFGIGLLNSFVNFAHHTYHLPQFHLIKWISFIVSMFEVIIFTKILLDIIKEITNNKVINNNISTKFIYMSKNWNLFLLPIAILISIPPINTLIHGTTVVMAHAMGSEIAIDTYILLGIFSFLLNKIFINENEKILLNSKLRNNILFFMNIFLIILISWLIFHGIIFGINRYFERLFLDFTNNYHSLFLILFGGLFALFLLFFLIPWIKILIKKTNNI